MYTRELAIQAYELSPRSSLGKSGLLLLTQFNNIDRAIEASEDEKVTAILCSIKAQEKAGTKKVTEKNMESSNESLADEVITAVLEWRKASRQHARLGADNYFNHTADKEQAFKESSKQVKQLHKRMNDLLDKYENTTNA